MPGSKLLLFQMIPMWSYNKAEDVLTQPGRKKKEMKVGILVETQGKG